MQLHTTTKPDLVQFVSLAADYVGKAIEKEEFESSQLPYKMIGDCISGIIQIEDLKTGDIFWASGNSVEVTVSPDWKDFY